ncbi:MAG TPA: BACON domain-containing carbohydrate-binding protein, partial [Burkholderiales bacterium]
SWVTVTSDAQRIGSGNVTYAVSKNSDIGERRTGITVADRTFAIRQSGDSGSCQYAVAPVDVRPCMPGGILTATITTQPFCPWTAASSTSWLTVSGATSGSGSGFISFGFSDNYDAPRQGIIMVRWPTPTAGQNIQVAQAGCRYAVSRSAFSLAATSGSGTFDVIQQSDPNTCGGATQDRCVWTARSDAPWITITSSMPRTGDNPVAFAVAANDATGLRGGTISVRDKVVTITQAGR